MITLPAKHPLERPDPTAELVLRDYEDPQIRCAPLQQLTAQLLEALTDRLLVPHARGENTAAGRSLGGRGR